MERWCRFGPLLAVVVLAALVRLWVVHSLAFDGLYGQDAYAYYYHGLALWRDHLLTYHWPWLAAPLRLFWPLGFPALLALVFALIGHASAPAAQLICLSAGLGVVVLVYLLALRVADGLFAGTAKGSALGAPMVGTLAASLVALAGLQVQASATIMADAPALFWGTAAIWLWTTPDRPPQDSGGRLGPLVRAFLAGACYALAVSTRIEYGLLIVPMAVNWWLQRSELAREDRRDGRWPRFRAAHTGMGPDLDVAKRRYLANRQGLDRAVVGAIGGVLAGLPQILYSLSYSAPLLQHQWLRTWSPAHLWQATFTTVDGTQRYPISIGAFYLLRPLFSPASLPATLAPFLFIGIVVLWRAGPSPFVQVAVRRVTSGRRLLLILLIWWLAPALYLSGVPYESARFALIYAPPLAILEAVGVVAAAQYLRQSLLWPTVLVRSCIVLWIVGSLAILVTEARAPLATLSQGKDRDLATVQWLQEHAPPGAHIATFGLTLTLYHYGDLAAHSWSILDLSAATSPDMQRAIASRRLVVVANVENLAQQWRGLAPERALRWFEEHTGLRRIRKVSGYTIFEQGSRR